MIDISPLLVHSGCGYKVDAVEKVCAELVNELFGDKMASLRRARRMSQTELGKAIGLSRATVANLEGGDQNVQLHQVFSIARALDTPVSQLLPSGHDVLETVEDPETRDKTFLRLAKLQLGELLGDSNEKP